VAHRIHHHLATSGGLFEAVRKTVAELQGAFALAVISEQDPDCVVLARAGCPVVIGLGIDENFVASDVAALLPVTRRFMFLEEGDVAEIRRKSISIVDAGGRKRARSARKRTAGGRRRARPVPPLHAEGDSRTAARDCANPGGAGGRREVVGRRLRTERAAVFKKVKAVHIAACGTSYHAAIVASYLIEQICRIPARVEIASEYRYRNPVVTPDTLFVTISQSGETADTLAALRNAKQAGYLSTLAICNVAESSMVRDSDLVLLTRAGPEIGVASTKAFTTQLTALGMLTVALGKNGLLDAAQERDLISQLLQLPRLVDETLKLDAAIQTLAESFVDKPHACSWDADRCTPSRWRAH
jgi:glucosamine--fructose-6-phosphate aminotransferase (isomerizing)